MSLHSRRKATYLAVLLMVFLLYYLSGNRYDAEPVHIATQDRLEAPPIVDHPANISLITRTKAANQSETDERPLPTTADCPALLERKYGADRFTRIPWQSNYANITFPEGSPVLDAQLCMASLSMKKVAVLLEMRADPDWVYHLLFFINKLDADWPFVVYHSSINEAMLRNNKRLKPHILSGKVQLHKLNTAFMSAWHISLLLTNAPFWNALAPATHVLMFQIDSTLCSGATSKIEDYFKYDFIGAVMPSSDPGEPPKYNGGFSLRNRNAMLQVIHNELPLGSPANEGRFVDKWANYYEDRWFSMTMWAANGTYRLPSAKEAKRFSVETQYFATPVAVHRPHRWLHEHASKKQVQKLFRNCPDVHTMPDKLGDMGRWDPCLNIPDSEACKLQKAKGH